MNKNPLFPAALFGALAVAVFFPFLSVARAAPEWQFDKAGFDASVPGPDGKPSLKLPPGSKAELKFSEGDVSGKVRLSVYDDGKVAVEGKGRGLGPRWGLRSGTGRVLAGGIFYAPYLGQGGSLCIVEADPAAKASWFGVNYLGKRSPDGPKWQEWVFDFHPESGLTVFVDGKEVPRKRFDWNATRFGGMDGIALFGDESGQPGASSLWVGGITFETGPPVKARPSAKAEASGDGRAGAAIPENRPVPDRDPEPDGKVWQMKPEYRNSHPRVLVSGKDLSALREFYKSDAGAIWRKKVEAYLGACKPGAGNAFLSDATDGQRQGLWRLPTVALHYLLTGDPSSLQITKAYLEKFLALPHWEVGKELDSGMSAANIMVGAALAYDWIYGELEPEFREKFREKLLLHARSMYYGGHLGKNPGPHYWQVDPANNHRWHRNAGLALALLAIYEGRPEELWIMQRAMEELAYVNKWLPGDGSSHEGPNYFTFGGNHLALAMAASDRLLDTKFLEVGFFKNLGSYRLHSLLPGMKGIFSYGDGGVGSVGGYNNFELLAASVHGQSDIKDGLLRLAESEESAFEFGWFSVLWDSPSVPRGDMGKLPTKAIFGDVGYATMRDSWRGDAVGASFLCGPMGGLGLNRFRREGGGAYINVAHDDPNALEFLIARGGEVLATTDGYSERKASQNHNTILVNGIGQRNGGRQDGQEWSQPGGDMLKMAYITAFKTSPKITAVEGEASGSYLRVTDKNEGRGRPAMDRVRRTFLWVEGDYILVLDDIRAPQEVEISWLVQGPDLVEVNAREGRFTLISGTESMPLQISASSALQTEIRQSPADDRGKPMGLRQLRASANGANLRFAAVFDAWNRGGPSIELQAGEGGEEAVIVTGKDFEDVWVWESAPDNRTASTISVERRRGNADGFPFRSDNSANAIAWLKEDPEK